MCCYKITEFPPPPIGKLGWPWTKESSQFPELMPIGNEWPKISIVTPNLNQGHFIEETIRSVLFQCYSNLEYIIIDGGSKDESVEIIKKYEPWLAYWTSEPDQGQSHAINKGFRVATGDFIGWLNADDRLSPGALEVVSKTYLENPEAPFVHGDCRYIDSNGNEVRIVKGFNIGQEVLYRYWLYADKYMNCIQQPSTFFRRALLERVGFLDENIHYCLDYDLWLKLTRLGFPPLYIPQILSEFRLHDQSKTCRQAEMFLPEIKLVAEREWQRRGLVFYAVMNWERKTWKSRRAADWICRQDFTIIGRFRRLLGVWARMPLVCLSRTFWQALILGRVKTL
jgi:glycosyltransferase involved in cell wall biosynthesis